MVTFFTGTEHRTAAWSFLVGVLSALVAVVTLVVDVWGPDDGGSAAQPAAGSSSASPSPSEPDLYVTAVSAPDDSACMALADPPTSLADRAELAAADSGPFELAERHGGAMVGQSVIDITLQGGRRGLTVNSIDVMPRTPEVAPPYDGVLLCSGGQGEAAKIELAADMDAPAPYLYKEGSPSVRHFAGHTITLAPQEQVAVKATFLANEGYREFDLVVRYTVDGKRRSLAVQPPSGDAYAVTAPSSTYDLGYLYMVTGSSRMSAREMCDASGAKEEC
ncbi:hypothetical protein ACFSUJ_12810 [Streptomyces lusitanus]|uniref:Secreted protein n=1 Tax=Streptomyces lusitanus TaxID=68232 RepID=A0ABU3JPL3_9ACTN|nr:hypothetical protein [Streptomyces lusitanus]